MLAPLLVFCVVFCVQNTEPVISFQLNSDIPNSAGDIAIWATNNENDGVFQLASRNVGIKNSDIPVLNVDRVMNTIRKADADIKTESNKFLRNLAQFFYYGPVSDLFGYIAYLQKKSDITGQNGWNNMDMTQLQFKFQPDFSKEILIIDVAKMRTEKVTGSKETVKKLIQLYDNTEMESLFSNILELFNMQENLKKYNQLVDDLIRGLGLNKPIPLNKLGFPKPTDEKPIVYFQLKDVNMPEAKYFVRARKHGDLITITILIEVNSSSMSNSYTGSPNEIDTMYQRLPISKMIFPILNV